MPIVRIDGKDYDTDKLSEGARNQLLNVQATDQELQRLQIQTAIAQTARIAYAKALQKALSEADEASAKAN